MKDYDWKQESYYASTGLEAWATPEGLWIGGWYDTHVEIPPELMPWDEIDIARKKAKRRKPLSDER